MKILNNNKKVYSTPQIECVKLDNEISLAMESAPTPDSGDEVMNKLPMEFAVEAQKLLTISLEGSVG